MRKIKEILRDEDYDLTHLILEKLSSDLAKDNCKRAVENTEYGQWIWTPKK